MKKMLKSLFAVAVLATAFTACSKDDAESAENTPREVKMTVVAGSDLEADGKSRTVLDPETNKISWNTSGEYLKVFETTGTTTSAATSAEGVITSGKAAFGVSFTENTTATSFTYNAIYPASAWVDGDNKDVAALKVITPSAQKPSATSFDGAADLLIAFPETSATQPQTLNVRFKRIVAIGKMTIKNLNSTENITSIQFQAANKTVTGRSKVDLNNGTVTEYGYTGQAVDNVVLDYTGQTIAANGMTAYFTCFPFAMAEGDTFTVTVTTETKRFTKVVTLAAGKPLEFTAGNSSTFGVNMAGIEGESIISGLRYATLTFDEIKADGGTDPNSKWGGYGKIYKYQQESGAIWDINCYYQTTYMQLGATSKNSYIKLPDFSKPISAVVVTLSAKMTGSLLLTSTGNSSTGDIASAVANNLLEITFDIADKNVTTAYLRSTATARVIKIEVNAGAGIVAPKSINVPAEEYMGNFTYDTAGFADADDTAISYDGTIVDLAEIDKTTTPATVNYTVTANTDFTKGRTGTITLSSIANDAKTIVSVEQPANVLTVPETVPQLGGNAGDKFDFSVTTGFKTIDYEGVADTFTVAQNGNAVTNEDGTYTYIYTVTAKNAGGSAEATLGTLTFYQTVNGQRIEPATAATVSIIQGAAGSSTAYYVKVTEAPVDNDWSGTYIIAKDAFAMNSGFSNGKLTTSSIDIVNNQILSSPETDAYAVTIVKNSNNNYTLQFATDSSYIGYKSSTNLQVGTSASGNLYEWTITLQSNGTVLIKNVNKTDRFIGWNNSDSFKAYATTNLSTYAQPVLYKFSN